MACSLGENHMRTLEQCAGDLVDLARTGDAYSESRIDAAVDACLVGSGTATAAKRKELADLFKAKAPVSDLSDRIRKRIMREN
jgi:hypothetical protein